MTIYFRKDRGHYRYQFKHQGKRYSGEPFATKKAAIQAEVKRKEELKKPLPPQKTAITFLELVEKRLDYIKIYNTKRYYDDYRYMARRWVAQWKGFLCGEITREMIEGFIINRSQVSNHVANKDLRCLKAVFNWGLGQELIERNPAARIKRLPIEKKIKYVPPKEDILKVLDLAATDVQDYLWVIILTCARSKEINNLTWDCVDLDKRFVILFTRKKKKGDNTPRSIPMVPKLYEILSRRHAQRDVTKPWVFWQKWWDNKSGEYKEGPFLDRKRIMQTLCKRANVRYFRFHALRHFGASTLKSLRVDERFIQEILGHTNLSTTHIYLQSVSGGSTLAMEKLEEELIKHTPKDTQ